MDSWTWQLSASTYGWTKCQVGGRLANELAGPQLEHLFAIVSK